MNVPLQKGEIWRAMHIVRISCEHEGKDGVMCPFTRRPRWPANPQLTPAEGMNHASTFFLDCQTPEREIMQYCGLRHSVWAALLDQYISLFYLLSPQRVTCKVEVPS